MREYKLSTARGKQLYNMGNTCCWSSLYNLYEKWSDAKERAGSYIAKEKIVQLLV